MKIQAAVARADAPFTIENCELSLPAAGEVRVKIEACGICHTDLLAKNNQLGTPLPAVLGHEGVGRIDLLGDGVNHFSIGDRVLISFGACGECSSCQQQASAYCQHARTINLLGRRLDGSSPICSGDEVITGHFFGQSSFATHVITGITNMVKLDDDLPVELMAPLACGVQTGMSSIINVLDAQPGTRIAIYGCGTVGLAAIMAAKIRGCAEIIAVDIREDRTEKAKELGATAAVVSGKDDIAAVMKSMGGVHYAFDCTGNASVIESACHWLLPRGQMLCAGVSHAGSRLSIDPNVLVFGGRSLRGTIEGDADPVQFIPQMIDWYRRGDLPLEKLVTTYPFDAINTAITDLADGRTIKPVLLMPVD